MSGYVYLNQWSLQLGHKKIRLYLKKKKNTIKNNYAFVFLSNKVSPFQQCQPYPTIIHVAMECLISHQ